MALSKQLNWPDDEMGRNIAILSSSCSYGIAIGSVISGFFV